MKRGISTYVFLLFASVSFSQESKPVISIKQLTDSILVIMKKEHITGLMLGITTKDSVLFSGGFGYADLYTKRLADESSLFRLGSITKMFVSLGIMKLVNDGKLKLDDELKKIAPEVPFQNRWEDASPVQIIHLLEHTTGFDDIKLNRMYSIDGKENTGIDMMLVHKKSMICRWKPGERFAYSNPNYTILGYIIEKISGQAYNRYLEENILNPLDMMNSNFNLKSKFPNKDVKEYIVKSGKTIPVKTVTLLSGAQGALWSSSEDMVKFLQLFLRNGSPLYRGGIINEMEIPHSSLAAQLGQKNGYALGNDNTFFGHAKYPFNGHAGVIGTCLSSCKYNRELGVGFVIASNCNNNNYRLEKIIVSYLTQNIAGKKLSTQPIDKKSIEPFLGRYQFESPTNEIFAFSDRLKNAPKVYFKNDKLYFEPLIGDPSELVQTAPMTFAWRDMNIPLVCFTKNGKGKKVMMIGGAYYEQTSSIWALLKRTIIIIALIFTFSSILLGIVSLIGGILGRIAWREVIPRIVPMVGVGFLVQAVLNLLEVRKYSYKLCELGSINFGTLEIFLGTSVFGIVSIVSLIYSINMFRRPNKSWFAGYSLLTSISLCLITTILWQNGWIGLRTWAL